MVSCNSVCMQTNFMLIVYDVEPCNEDSVQDITCEMHVDTFLTSYCANASYLYPPPTQDAETGYSNGYR